MRPERVYFNEIYSRIRRLWYYRLESLPELIIHAQHMALHQQFLKSCQKWTTTSALNMCWCHAIHLKQITVKSPTRRCPPTNRQRLLRKGSYILKVRCSRLKSHHLRIGFNMKTRNRQQSPSKTQAPVCSGEEPDTSRYQQIMDKNLAASSSLGRPPGWSKYGCWGDISTLPALDSFCRSNFQGLLRSTYHSRQPRYNSDWYSPTSAVIHL